MRDVFVSFQTANDTIARQATAYLESLGWSCWRCTRPADNVPGTNWTRRLAEELISAEVVLLLYSREAAKSPYVFREISMAVSLEKPVLVVQLDDTPFSPELRYLVRTMQTLDARGRTVGEWTPAVADALRVLLHSRCVLPIDSLADRRLKVRFCCELQRELFGDAPVRLLGVAVKLPGIVQRQLDQPQRIASQIQVLHHALASLAYVRQGAPSGCCVPFRAGEDIFFVICLFANVPEKTFFSGVERLARALTYVLREICEAQGGLRVEVRMGTSREWQRGDGDKIIEAYFAEVGGIKTKPRPLRRKSAGTKSGLEWPRLTAAGERLLARVARASSREHRNGQTVALSLPRAMTCVAAHERLGKIFACA